MKKIQIVKIIIIVAVICILTGVGINFLFKSNTNLPPITVSRTLYDVTYCTDNGIESKMDIYFPIRFESGLSPAVMYVHGGAWIFGDKEINTGTADVPELLSRGYIVVMVNYRLAPDYMFPAQIEDVKCAVRYLRLHATEYGIDSKHIGAWGDSAGGQLVSLLALTNDRIFNTGEYPNQSSRIQAAVDYFGPTNLTNPNFYNLYSAALDEIFGSYEKMIKASPVYYISNDSSKISPPFLIFQGDRDIVVFQEQSEELYKKLTDYGVGAQLVIVNGSTHGFAEVGGTMTPSRENITIMVANFFDKYLKG